MSSAFAHGDLDDRIDAFSLEIKQWPDSAELYLNRAELYLQHIDYQKALDDIDQSLTLGEDNFKAIFIQSKSYFGLGQCEEALSRIENYLLKDMDHVKALNLQAEILFEMREFEKAADVFLAVISKANSTIPENYLNAALAYEKSNNIPLAISILQQGKIQLGEVRSLIDRLIELHLHNNDFNSAIALQHGLIESSKRKEMQLYNAAQICMKSKNYKQAEFFLKEAAIEFNRLPKHIRFNRAMRELKINIDESLTTLHQR